MDRRQQNTQCPLLGYRLRGPHLGARPEEDAHQHTPVDQAFTWGPVRLCPNELHGFVFLLAHDLPEVPYRVYAKCHGWKSKAGSSAL